MSIEFAGPAIIKKIILCPMCEGTGEEKYIHHKSGHDSEQWKKPCECCETSGRLIEITTVEQKPFHSSFGGDGGGL